jgi:predicted nucleotidyltransferase
VTLETSTQQIRFVNNTFVNVAGKLQPGLVELYTDISEAAASLGIKFLVVGAMARDLVLVHGYGSIIERGTKDVDFGISVASWDDFDRLKTCLLEAGFQPDEHKAHKLTRNDLAGLPWEVDIVPFGGIADDNQHISWPPEQAFVMTVLGFAEAFENSLTVQISEAPDITIPVASPAGVAILKLVAWLDRERESRAKDAMDFKYLIQSYTNIPDIFEAVYEEGCMEAQEWDENKASAMKLGTDAGAIALSETKAFLKEQLFEHPGRKEQFARDMQGPSRSNLMLCAELLDIFGENLLKRVV